MANATLGPPGLLLAPHAAMGGSRRRPRARTIQRPGPARPGGWLSATVPVPRRGKGQGKGGRDIRPPLIEPANGTAGAGLAVPAAAEPPLSRALPPAISRADQATPRQSLAAQPSLVTS